MRVNTKIAREVEPRAASRLELRRRSAPAGKQGCGTIYPLEDIMIQLVFLYLGAGLTSLWGVAHLFPTKSVVEGFGEITLDNRRIITMEWIVEGIALIFIGLLVAMVTFIDPVSSVSKAVYGLSIIGLVALAIVSVFTGYKINFIPFKLCPFIFTGSAAMICVGGLL